MTTFKVFAVISLISFLYCCLADYIDYPQDWANELTFPSQFVLNKRVPEERSPYDSRSITLLKRLAQVAKRLVEPPYELRSKFELEYLLLIFIYSYSKN